MQRPSPALPALATLALVTVYSAAALYPALERSRERLTAAAAHRRETELAARTRLFGAAYAVSLESIRQALAEREPYLLVEAVEAEDGAKIWVRYDLAPRPAVNLGRMGQLLPGHPGLDRLEHATLRFVVVASAAADGPDFYERGEFLREIAPGAPAQPGHGR